jgi:succinylarginine dihydrolase
MGWEQTFHDPIELPDDRVLRTLRDAGHYIQELPRAVQDRPEWQTAVYASAPDRSAAHHAALAARKAPPEGMEGRGKS